jgi:hypothetical protein
MANSFQHPLAGNAESDVVTRTASCSCGQLQAVCTGEPLRISVCHCLACQKRSGSAFAAQARFQAKQVTITGDSRRRSRIADSGNAAEFHFCPECGSIVFYHSRPHFEAIAVPIGAFADPGFPAPWVSVYEQRKHPWVSIVGEDIEHFDR